MEHFVIYLAAGELAQRRADPRTVQHSHGDSDRKDANDLVGYF
jgi:hypothetical protein